MRRDSLFLVDSNDVKPARTDVVFVSSSLSLIQRVVKAAVAAAPALPRHSRRNNEVAAAVAPAPRQASSTSVTQ
jgi:hypothetical protein